MNDAAPVSSSAGPALLSERRGDAPAPDVPSHPLESLPQEKKISLDAFARICWQASRTNLTYRQFLIEHEPALVRIFFPVAK